MALIGVIASSAMVVVFPGNQLIAAATTCATANTLNAGAFGQSNFEIDAPVADNTKLGAHAGANLTNDGGSPCIDWSQFAAGTGTGTETDKTSGVTVKHDLASGSGDDSFTQGTSENATDPTVAFGSIPPNKSDLQTFWIYKETNATGKFLNLAWSRINSPSGTVTMDFELNKVACNNNAATCSNNAPKGTLYDIPLRSNGDKLIVYNLASGGTVPTLSIYTWSGNSTSGTWGTGTLISGGSNPEALGSINFSPISATNSVGLGDKDSLTFGEASISFAAIFGTGGTCGSFGSVYLKSRSSNTFTDELKDFILPQPVTLTNCTGLTTAASGPVTIGQSITDTATLSGGTSPTGTITFLAFSDAGCATQVFSSLVSVTSGNGNYTSGSFTPSTVGTYYWTASYSGDSNNAPAATKCGDSGESSVVNQAKPQLTTTASTDVAIGGSISDTAHLSGGVGPTGTITFNVFSDAGCLTASLSTSSAAVSGNGDYSSATFTPTTAGTYYWTASYSGDTNNAAVATKCGDSNESNAVNPLTPTISTTACATGTTCATSPVVVGTALDDTAHLGNTANQPNGSPAGGTIKFTLYGPALTPTDCNIVVGSSSVSVSGNGDYKASSGSITGTLTPTLPGTYLWVASYGGNLPNTTGPVSTTCGDAGESTNIIRLPSTISTTQSWTPNDSATVTGGGTGSVTFTLYKNDATCTSNSAIKYGPVTVALDGSGNASTNNTTFKVTSVTASDAYYWGADYSGDATHKAVSSCVEVTTFSSLVNDGPVTSP